MRPKVPTNFSGLDDNSLLWMLWRSNPEAIRDVAVAWDAMAVGLEERAYEIELQLGRLQAMWSGDVADSYALAIRSLIRATRRVAAAGFVVRDVLAQTAEALDQARAQFPPPEGFDPAVHMPRRPHELASGEHVIAGTVVASSSSDGGLYAGGSYAGVSYADGSYAAGSYAGGSYAGVSYDGAGSTDVVTGTSQPTFGVSDDQQTVSWPVGTTDTTGTADTTTTRRLP